uniref:Putative ovule protein n=1 Tax=Solanum chacoense TaxID=4108 RepID=A0A0V0GZL3_SOLCH
MPTGAKEVLISLNIKRSFMCWSGHISLTINPKRPRSEDTVRSLKAPLSYELWHNVLYNCLNKHLLLIQDYQTSYKDKSNLSNSQL